MISWIIGTGIVMLFFVLLGSGVWVALSLLAIGIASMEFYSSAPVGRVLASTVWGAMANWNLTALPLFIWMGEILFRTKLAENMFRGVAPWVNRLPGRLLHINVIGCGIFAAVSGSSAATAATVGRLTLPELERAGYNRRLSVGSLAAAGSLGMLIPPSIVLIVYGIAAEVSIARLFLAGLLPGLLLMFLFAAYIAVRALRDPSVAPPSAARLPFWKRVAATRHLLPVLLLIVFVIGSIYSGVATPTEAAAVGVMGALAISIAQRSLNRRSFTDALVAATHTTCMIGFIMATAAFFSVAMGFSGIPVTLSTWIADQGFTAYSLLAILTVFFIIVGCFLDGISIIVLTAAVILPAVQAVGVDLLWFGIYLVILVEMSQITPPVGFNLFVVQAISGDDIVRVARASAPFFALMLLEVVILIVFPEVVTFLPNLLS
tara:strand:+ start:41474 stop:42772 length:1299 start_codon:yes stop_codon:yes gene_type:complete